MPICSPSHFTISGFTRVCRLVSVLITTTRSPTPTWGAASPTPGAATIVSTMSSISLRMLLSTRGTRFAFWRRIGASWVRMGRTAMLSNLHRVDVEAPAPASRSARCHTVQVAPFEGQLEAEFVLEPIHERGRWSEDLDVAQIEQGDCSTQMFSGRLRLELRASLVPMPVGGQDQLGEGRKSIGAPDLELLAIEAPVVVVTSMANGGMLRCVGLDEHL